MWPTIDFGDEIGDLVGVRRRRPRLIARVSVTSLSGVEVPWATMWSISSGATPAWRIALVIAIAAPRPVGSGAEMWYASAVSAAPTTSARIVAPRASACSADSMTTTPAPSPKTKPSRVRSNGREAPSRVVVALRQRAHVRERGEGHRQQRRLRAAGEDDVALARCDQPQRVLEGDDARARTPRPG